jgi:hypothetical protein
MPVCVPGSLPVFVGTVTTVAGRGSPADSAELEAWPFEIPYLVDSPPPKASPGASSVGTSPLKAQNTPAPMLCTWAYPSSCLTRSARKRAVLSAVSASLASTMTRTSGSVPDARTSTRPSSPSDASTS